VIAEFPPLNRPVPFAIALLVAGLLCSPQAEAQVPTISDFSVDFSQFSPDGDGVQDVVRYRYTLGGIAAGDSAHMRIEVQTGTETAPTGAVVNVLLDAYRQAGPDTVVWDGRSTSGILQPDGYYWFLAEATTPTDTATVIPVRVTLDTEAPSIFIVDVANPYTPDIPGADSLARVTVDLSGIGEGDRLELGFRGPKPSSAQSTHFEDVTQNGILVVGWSGRTSADGMYGVTARVFDGAGHENTAVGPDLNLDITAPGATITTPARPDTNEYIGRVEGEVTDRSGLARVLITVMDASDSTKAVADSLPCPCTEQTRMFAVDVPDSVAQTDTLLVDLLVVDLPGHERLTTMTYVVDMVPPPPPILDPLTPTVTRPSVDYEGTATEADSVYVFVDGGLLTGHLVRVDRFEGNVDLSPGPHTLQARAHDKAGNVSAMGPGVSVSYDPTAGILVPERFLAGDVIQVNLETPAQGVVVNILTLRGRQVRTLESTEQTTNYDIAWDLNDDDGNPAGSGPYLFHIVVDQGSGSKFQQRVIAVVTR
jgi:flagellar hook assembly protein FlgD